MAVVSVIWLVTAVYLVALLYVGLRVAKRAGSNFGEYAIGGKALGLLLVGFTFVASAWGAGDFIGTPDQGYHAGLKWFPFILGSEGGKVIFALVLAGFAARYAFNTLGEFLNELVVRDRATRAIVGVLTILASVAWLGGQYLAVGYVFSTFTGADPTLIIVLAAIVMIAYTCLGGIWSVAWTDVIQGLLIVVFSAFYYLEVFSKVNFSLGYLREQVLQAKPELWSWGGAAGIPWATILTLFFTGLFGLFTQNMFWQRCFASRTPQVARNGFLVMGLGAILVSSLSLLVGLTAYTLNPGLDAGIAAYVVKELLPPWLMVVVTLLVMGATMSTADSHLNSTAIVTVNDLIRPFRPDWDDQKLVRAARLATIFWGLFSLIGALTFKFIFDLVALGYTAAGAAIFPLFVVGLLWRKPGAQGLSWQATMVTPVAARVALVAGSVSAVIFHSMPSVKAVLGGGIIPGALVTAVLLVVVSLLTSGTSGRANDESSALVS